MMNICCLKAVLAILLMLYVLMIGKTDAHTNEAIDTNICLVSLLNHESALSTFFDAIKEDDIDKLPNI